MAAPVEETPGVLDAAEEVYGPKSWSDTVAARREEGRRDLSDGRWVQGDRLGEGGMGYVQRATDVHGQDKVLKRVNRNADPDRVREEEATLRYESETYDRVGAHPNLAETYGLTEDMAGGGIMGMEMLKGGDGDAMMAQLKAAYDARKISHAEYWGAVTSMQRDALSGLQHLGQHNLVHGDMKPANLMYDETGTAKLIDLGAAGEIGTAGSDAKSHQVNMTPEWAANNVLDESNDVYALGQMAHAAVHGEYRDKHRPRDASGAAAQESGADKAMRLFGDRTREHQRSRGAGGWFRRHFGSKKEPNSAAEDFIHQTVTARGAAPQERRQRDMDRHARSGAEGPYQAQYGGKYRLNTEEAAAHPFLSESILDNDEGRAVAARMIAERKEGVTYGPKKTDLELSAEGRAASEARVRQMRLDRTAPKKTADALDELMEPADGSQVALKAALNQELHLKTPKTRAHRPTT